MSLIRQIKEKDLEQLALLHKSNFDEYHFTHYFTHKMLKDYISSFINYNEECILFEEGNEILGYIIGGNKIQSSLNDYLKRNRLKLFFILLIHPGFLLEKLLFLFRKLNRKNNATVHETLYKIYIIAVSKKVTGKGIGKELIYYFEEKLRNKEVKNYTLSVRKSNPGALSFYLKLGFTITDRKSGSIYLNKDI